MHLLQKDYNPCVTLKRFCSGDASPLVGCVQACLSRLSLSHESCNASTRPKLDMRPALGKKKGIPDSCGTPPTSAVVWRAHIIQGTPLLGASSNFRPDEHRPASGSGPKPYGRKTLRRPHSITALQKTIRADLRSREPAHLIGTWHKWKVSNLEIRSKPTSKKSNSLLKRKRKH